MVNKSLRRREFLKAGTAGMAVASTAIRISKAATPPSDQLQAGFIGMGRQGIFNTRKFAEHPEVKVAAVCDVYQPHLDQAYAEFAAEKYSDFRRILDRKDIDIVVISSPDHWHPLMTVMACQAGKDVYVEKPISVAVAEGRKMVEAARKHKRVVQVGTQQRSGTHFQQAVDLIRQGKLGEITAVRSWNFGNDTPNGIGNPRDSEVPDGLDWDFWLGPAPKVPFNANRFGVAPNRWSTFRYFWDYAGGMMTDWGVHLLDIVQWAMNVDAPTAVSALGGKFKIKDNRDTPDTLTVTYQYPSFICTYENRACNGRNINEHGYGMEYYGTEGTMFLDRSGFQIIPERRRVGENWEPRMSEMKVEDSNDSNHDHVKNFLDCVKDRKNPISDIEVGHYSTTTCLLANISYLTGRKLIWDAKKEQITGDKEANEMLTRKYRSPWKLA
jgi:predicted dehydrogenase